jgi:hypothetical protein
LQLSERLPLPTDAAPLTATTALPPTEQGATLPTRNRVPPYLPGTEQETAVERPAWARCLLSAPMPRASAPHPARLTPYPPTLAPHARRLAQCAATLAPYKGRSTQRAPPFTPHQGTFAQLARRVAQYAGTLARRASTFPELAERFVCVA